MGRGASAFCLFTFRIFKKIFYFARTHTKKLSPLLLLIWNSLQHPAVSYVWYSFDPQHISCLTSVPLHFLLNSESIITTPGRIFFYTYTESMLLTSLPVHKSEKGDRMLELFSSFPRAAGLALPSAMPYTGLEVCVFLGVHVRRQGCEGRWPSWSRWLGPSY